MFPPRYKLTSESDAIVARRITFFGRSKESSSGPLDRVDHCDKLGSGHEIALELHSKQVQPHASRQNQAIQGNANASSRRSGKDCIPKLELGNEKMPAHGPTPSQLSLYEFSVAKPDLLVSDGSSGNGRTELHPKFRPTRSGFLHRRWAFRLYTQERSVAKRPSTATRKPRARSLLPNAHSDAEAK